MKKYYGIFNKITKKLVEQEDGEKLYFEYQRQAEQYIAKRLGEPMVFDIVEIKKRGYVV